MSLDERNARLEEKIEQTDLPAAVTTLIKDAKRRRRQLRLITVSIILDLLLTLGLTYLSFQTRSLATKSESNQDAIVRTCTANNESRANNKGLWNYLLDLPPEHPLTPLEQSKLDGIRKVVTKTFAPRDCSNVIQ